MSLTVVDQERIGRWHEDVCGYLERHPAQLTTYDSLRGWAYTQWQSEMRSVGRNGRAQADYALAATWLELGPPKPAVTLRAPAPARIPVSPVLVVTGLAFAVGVVLGARVL